MSQFKVVMLPTEKATFPCICETMKDPFKGVGNGDFELVDALIRCPAKYYHLYIVDTQATIQVDDIIKTKYDDVIGRASKTFNADTFTPFEKVVASTDESLGLPTLHPETIQRYIDNPQLEIADVIYNVGVVNPNGTWGNYFNADDYHTAVDLTQSFCNDIRLMVFWQEPTTPEFDVDFEMIHAFSNMEGDHLDKYDLNLIKFLKAIEESQEFAVLAHQKLSSLRYEV